MLQLPVIEGDVSQDGHTSIDDDQPPSHGVLAPPSMSLLAMVVLAELNYLLLGVREIVNTGPAGSAS